MCICLGEKKNFTEKTQTPHFIICLHAHSRVRLLSTLISLRRADYRTIKNMTGQSVELLTLIAAQWDWRRFRSGEMRAAVWCANATLASIFSSSANVSLDATRAWWWAEMSGVCYVLLLEQRQQRSLWTLEVSMWITLGSRWLCDRIWGDQSKCFTSFRPVTNYLWLAIGIKWQLVRLLATLAMWLPCATWAKLKR